MRRSVLLLLVATLVVLSSSVGGARDEAPGDQLDLVRQRIRALQERLTKLDGEVGGVRAQKDRLTTELELAEARVAELEVELARRATQIQELRAEVAELSRRLEERRSSLQIYLEMAALLGEAGPLQLVWDGARGGELMRSLDTVVTLTRGQLAAMEEFASLQTERRRRLAELSRRIEEARSEAAELDARRQQLGEVRQRVARQLETMEARRAQTQTELQDMQARAAALQRLLERLRGRDRITGSDDVREFRGALPWPARGPVARTFGKHFLEKYATYTICNGVRLHVQAGSEVRAVFPGVVAYARYFKGYGNMVVIDHGNDVLSVLTGLSSVLVNVDQRVSMGRPVGIAGPAKEGGNFYFEIRVDGEPQDPSSWLRL
jgi:septal ring factor EnvC (AmiA/AmiB activator)